MASERNDDDEKARPLLWDGNNPSAGHGGSNIDSLRSKFNLYSNSSKEVDVSISAGALMVGKIRYDVKDIVGATTTKNGFVVHSYPKAAGGCCSSGGARSYKSIRLFCRDSNKSQMWVTSICRFARDLPPGSNPPGVRKMLCYVNPFSGTGSAPQIMERAKPMFQHAGIEPTIIETKKANQVREDVAKLNLEEWDGVIIVSGDGLVVEYINGIMDRKDWESAIARPFGVIPGGSGNGLVHSFNHVAEEAIDEISSIFHILKGKTHRLDLLSYEISGGTQSSSSSSSPSSPSSSVVVYGFLSLAWGLIADIDLNSEVIRCCGSARFTLWAIFRLCCSKSYQATLKYTPSGEGWKYGSSNNSREQGIHTLKTLRNRKTVVTNEPKSANSIMNDGQPEAAAEQKIPSGGRSSRPMSETVACKIFTLIYASSPPRVSDEILLAPKAKLDDGKIHLSYLEGSNCCSTLCGLLRLEDGTHEKDPRFKSIQVDQFRVETDSKTAAALYSLDGERLDTNGAVTVRIHPKVLNVFCIGN